jgi:hypothetical protein
MPTSQVAPAVYKLPYLVKHISPKPASGKKHKVTLKHEALTFLKRSNSLFFIFILTEFIVHGTKTTAN